MARNSRIVAIALVVGLALVSGAGQPALATNNVLRIQPTTTVVPPGSGPFDVQVMVDNVHTGQCTLGGQTGECGLGAYTVELHFDPTIIQCEDIDPNTAGCQNVTNGPFLLSTGRTLWGCSNSGTDLTNGIIKYTCTTTGTPPPPNGSGLPFGKTGSGLLATVRFAPTGPASPTPSPLDLDESILVDIQGTGPGQYPICAPLYTPCVTQNGTATVNYRSDLSLSKTGPSSVAAPTNVSYTLQATNLGPDQAPSVTVVDTLPSAETFVSASAGCAYDGGSGTVTCDLGSMTVGPVKSVTITASVPPSAAGQTLLNAADVSTTATDQVSANNHAEASTQVSPSTISITQTAPRDVALGVAGQYVIAVSSSGQSAAAAVVVTDTLWRNTPPGYYYGATYVSHSTTVGTCLYDGVSKTLTCNLGDMASSASATITINVTFPTGAEPLFPHPDTSHPTGTYVGNTATATWTAAPPNSRSVTKWTYVGLLDTDGDGCHNYQELGSNPLKGGGRNPNNPYDFYDVPTGPIHFAGTGAAKDYGIGPGDLSALSVYGNTRLNGPPNIIGVDYDEDLNYNGVPDGQEYDYCNNVTGCTGPGGGIAGRDLSALSVQGGARCLEPF